MTEKDSPLPLPKHPSALPLNTDAGRTSHTCKPCSLKPSLPPPTFRPPLTLIRRRYEKYLGIAKEDFDRSFSLDTLSRKLKEVKPNIRASCTKAVIFSWCTGSRFQNKEKQCILGCDAADQMEHYCQCPPLWEGIAFATRSHFKIAESARERWGIEGWSSEGVLTLAIATATFQQLSHSSSDPAAAASAAMRSFGLLNDARPQHGTTTGGTPPPHDSRRDNRPPRPVPVTATPVAHLPPSSTAPALPRRYPRHRPLPGPCRPGSSDFAGDLQFVSGDKEGDGPPSTGPSSSDREPDSHSESEASDATADKTTQGHMIEIQLRNDDGKTMLVALSEREVRQSTIDVPFVRYAPKEWGHPEFFTVNGKFFSLSDSLQGALADRKTEKEILTIQAHNCLRLRDGGQGGEAEEASYDEAERKAEYLARVREIYFELRQKGLHPNDAGAQAVRKAAQVALAAED